MGGKVRQEGTSGGSQGSWMNRRFSTAHFMVPDLATVSSAQARVRDICPTFASKPSMLSFLKISLFVKFLITFNASFFFTRFLRFIFNLR